MSRDEYEKKKIQGKRFCVNWQQVCNLNGKLFWIGNVESKVGYEWFWVWYGGKISWKDKKTFNEIVSNMGL
jgi:hypothetical protein